MCTRKRNTELFIQDCIIKRGDIYDYSMVNYVNNKKKVVIICKEHGPFEQTPNNHLSKNQDCPKCSLFYFESKSIDQVINDFQKKHGNKYDYSKVRYNGNKTKVEIICKVHGSFFQTPNNHLKGQNCPQCIKITTDEFIEKSKKIHSDKYDYSEVDYVNMNKKVKIVCKNHGLFTQRPHSHLYGVGCPKCQESKGQREIRKILEILNIQYLEEHSFEECKFIKKLRFDFFIPEKNMCIEFDGKQHFTSDYYGGIKSFNMRKKRDNIKSDFCKKNNINLLRIRYDENIEKKLFECL